MANSPQLTAYVDLLLRWGEKINLIGSLARADAVSHVEDCEHLLPHVPAEATSLVDVGAGGGLPAVVLAIGRPGLKVTAVEPRAKRHAFLRTCARELALVNLEARNCRFEDLPEHQWDVATSRATFALPEWLERGRTLVRPGGVVLAMEGQEQFALPSGADRFPYKFGNRQRAIVRLVV